MPNQPASELTDNPKQNRLFLLIILGLSLITLLCLGYVQLNAVHAQTAPSNVDFGSATVGTQGQTRDITFSNTYTNTTLSVSDEISVDANYTVLNNGCAQANVGPGNSCSVSIRFNPQTPGPHPGTVAFFYSDNSGLRQPGAGDSKINSVGGSSAKVNNNLYALVQQVQGSTSTSLTGTGLAATTTAPTTTVATTAPPTTTPLTTKAPSTCASQIQGYVVIDGKPGEGVRVNLTGPSKDSVTIGSGGFFYFNNLCGGTYQVSLVYDKTKYKANDPDVRTISLGDSAASRDNEFSLSAITATTAAPTTPAATAAPTTVPSGTTAAPTTPAPTTTVPAQVPSCSLPGGTVLRVCTATTQQSATHFALVIGVQAGDSPVNLNDTVVLSLPIGASVASATSAVGAVTVSNNNTVRWGSFSLNPKQSASLVLSIDAPAGNLNGSSIFVSGSFNRSQAFQQRIPGLPGLTDIVPAAPATTGTGGKGGVPAQAPATGTAQESSQDIPVAWLILAVVASGGLGILGLFLTGRTKKPGNKEQK